MRWLLTVPRAVETEVLRERLAARGAELDRAVDPVPLGESEQAVTVEGPDDLPARLADDDLVRAVYPDSEMSYCDDGGEDPEGGC